MLRPGTAFNIHCIIKCRIETALLAQESQYEGIPSYNHVLLVVTDGASLSVSCVSFCHCVNILVHIRNASKTVARLCFKATLT